MPPPPVQGPNLYPPPMPPMPFQYPQQPAPGIPPVIPSGHVSAVAADSQTRFLGSLINQDHAYRIFASIRLSSGDRVLEYPLDKSIVQADQGSEMNLVSM